MIECYTGNLCTPATYDIPPEPPWAAGANVTYTVTSTNGQSFAYNPGAIPGWITVNQTATSISFTGTRPGTAGFSLSFDLISCGVTQSVLLDYPGPSTICQQCLFNLIQI